MRIKTLPVLVALGLAGTALQAQAMDDRFYVAPSLSYTFADGDRQADDDWGLGVALGKPVTPNWNLELALTGSQLDLEAGGGEYELLGLGIDALYVFNRDAGFTPYGVLGIGALRTDVPGNDDTGLMANVGLGIMKRLTDNIALRADARYRWDDNSTDAFNESSFGDWVVNVGLSIALGQKAQPAPKPEPAPEPAPVAKPEPVKPAPVDSDGDGVTDDKDRCPNTPKGRKVNAEGCELDSDGDGVVDALDQCPDTPAGDKVDTKGCSLMPVIVLKGVNFDHDSAKLRPESQAILDDAVTTLKRYTEIKVEVAGHTDNRGSDSYNQKLSERRAKSVMEYFVGKGIAAERMSAKGYGESQPVADNATAAGRAQNRRVELRIIEGK